MAVATALSSSLATLGGWQLLRKVGEGATSTVYLAKGVDGRQAALKVLLPGDRSDPNDLPLIASLERRWGPAWLDAGRGESPFIATEWVEGEPLVGASPREVWAVVHAVARALAELHEAGVRHGDVKPTNILWHGRVPARDVPGERGATLIDLGLATHVGEQARGGTPAYAAPELLRGEDVGPRADVFALGVMVRELARGDAALLRSRR